MRVTTSLLLLSLVAGCGSKAGAPVPAPASGTEPAATGVLFHGEASESKAKELKSKLEEKLPDGYTDVDIRFVQGDDRGNTEAGYSAFRKSPLFENGFVLLTVTVKDPETVFVKVSYYKNDSSTNFTHRNRRLVSETVGLANAEQFEWLQKRARELVDATHEVYK